MQKTKSMRELNQKLWYTAPAREWIDGLPLGTGRLAAMIMGTVKRERLALNHEWLWKGTHRFRDTEKRSHLLDNVRRLLLEGKYAEGARAGNDAFGGKGGTSGQPNCVDPYQPAGDLYFELNHGVIHNYRRILDLKTALADVGYEADYKKFSRQYLAHLGEDLILIKISAEDKPFDCAVWLDRVYDPDCELRFSAAPNLLNMDGNIKNGLDFRVEAQVWNKDGKASIHDRKAVFAGAREILIAINIGTSANNGNAGEECKKNRLSTQDWPRLMESHRQEYARVYNGLELSLPFDESDIPTNERLENLRRGEKDPGLALLFFNYGRYLLCASAAKGQLPPNLQGKWCEDLNPPWECDYHHDINLQMNYWGAEPGGLAACAEPLFQHIERFMPHAGKAARDLYDCRGVFYPIQTDAWGRATPESYGYAVWIGAAAWLAQHMWWHYEYGQDKEFLRARAYPFIKEVAAFYEDYLIEDEHGTLQIVPSQSPENRFKESGETMCPVSLCVSSAMDIELAWDLLTHAIKAGEILGVDDDRRRVWQDMLNRLPKIQTGSQGQILEWNREFEEGDPGHRHLSPLFGLFPGEQITPEGTPELFRAALTLLERRLAHGSAMSGWATAWAACCFARIGDGDRALDHLNHLLKDFVAETLLDIYPPRIFQIDGNLGAMAVVLEMLIQGYHEKIHLLPALPSAWRAGQVRGLRARGGYTVNIEWQEGKITRAEIRACADRLCAVKISGPGFIVKDSRGNFVSARREHDCLLFEVKKGELYALIPEGGK